MNGEAPLPGTVLSVPFLAHWLFRIALLEEEESGRKRTTKDTKDVASFVTSAKQSSAAQCRDISLPFTTRYRS